MLSGWAERFDEIGFAVLSIITGIAIPVGLFICSRVLNYMRRTNDLFHRQGERIARLEGAKQAAETDIEKKM